MKRTLLIVLLLAVATTGCTLGPAYQRPQVPTPDGTSEPRNRRGEVTLR